ncbi:lysozyme inhibitor LprI family protein [Dyella sp. KULCS107]|uniref:lysozyme inhibitor LprI family protein n=1 Tax=Dyella sp. KULCS107 TaxID=3422216 RepID=UPI003D6F64F0
MQPSALRNSPLNPICVAPLLGRFAGQWLAGIAIAAMVFPAHGQDAAPKESPLRPSYHACVSASQGVTAALNDCIGAELAFQDKRLNGAYQQLRISLPKDGRLALRSEERAWIAHRDRRCAPDPEGGTAAMLDANQCRLDETAARAAVLEERTLLPRQPHASPARART